MILKHASAILQKMTATSDNARVFRETYMHFLHKDDDELLPYIQFIAENTKEWLENLPEKYKSIVSKAKAKTSIIKLLSNEDVASDLGSEVCTKTIEVLNDTWKQFKNHHNEKEGTASNISQTDCSYINACNLGATNDGGIAHARTNDCHDRNSILQRLLDAKDETIRCLQQENQRLYAQIEAQSHVIKECLLTH